METKTKERKEVIKKICSANLAGIKLSPSVAYSIFYERSLFSYAEDMARPEKEKENYGLMRLNCRSARFPFPHKVSGNWDHEESIFKWTV